MEPSGGGRGEGGGGKSRLLPSTAEEASPGPGEEESSHTKLSPTQIPEHLKLFLFWFYFREDEWHKKETSSRISLGRKFANRLLVNILLSAIAFFLRIHQWQENNIMQLYLRIVIVLTLNQLT